MVTAKKAATTFPSRKVAVKKAPAKKAAAKEAAPKKAVVKSAPVQAPGGRTRAVRSSLVASTLTMADLFDTVVAIEKSKQPPLPPGTPISDADFGRLVAELRAMPLPAGLSAEELDRFTAAIAQIRTSRDA